MRKVFIIVMIGLALSSILVSFSPVSHRKPVSTNYIVIAWNDLGMHCANQDFSNLCILPPYNNQYAHVIATGDSFTLPQVLSTPEGVYATYEIPGNTYSVGKTNFWTYAEHLFGVSLLPDIGLTGAGLTGTMTDTLNYHFIEGIPITAFPDAAPTIEDPYQLTLIKAYGSGAQLLATTQSVIPVSHEVNCVSSGCHSSELNILNMHETVPGFNIANKPILCAQCHADNALGLPGQSGTPPFSQVIHQTHGGETNTCYKCHPGPNTQCFRDVMHTAGLTCQTCHGSVSDVGNTIEQGREPWLEEPSCGASSCHGPNYAEEPGKLFRHSKGHGGLYCSTCHGSPHAILPSENERDNMQNFALQGYAGTLRKCEVCHGYIPTAPGPHGYNPLGIQPVDKEHPGSTSVGPVYPNPASDQVNIPFSVAAAGLVELELLDGKGAHFLTILSEDVRTGNYCARIKVTRLSQGIWFIRLNAPGGSSLTKLVVTR